MGAWKAPHVLLVSAHPHYAHEVHLSLVKGQLLLRSIAFLLLLALLLLTPVCLVSCGAFSPALGHSGLDISSC